MICPFCKIEVQNLLYHSKICMVNPKNIKPAKFVEVPACKSCGVAISQQTWDNAIKIHFLPLCEKCEPIIRKRFEICKPLFDQLKLKR